MGDSSAIKNLLSQVDGFDIFMGDGAYDGDLTYKKILDKIRKQLLLFHQEKMLLKSPAILSKETFIQLP